MHTAASADDLYRNDTSQSYDETKDTAAYVSETILCCFTALQSLLSFLSTESSIYRHKTTSSHQNNPGTNYIESSASATTTTTVRQQ